MSSIHRSERRPGAEGRSNLVMTRLGIADRVRLGLEYFTGATAIVGGLLLVAKPDGTLLQAGRSALATSPFDDWRVPGILLTVLVGGGFVITAECQRRRWAHDRELATVAGTGLIVFELAEVAWIGVQPLEVVFGVVGATVAVLARRGHSELPRRAWSQGWADQRARTGERQVT